MNIEFERLWYKIQNDKIKEEAAAELYFSYQKEVTEILNFDNQTLFKIDENIIAKADNKMNIFLKNNHGIAINMNA